MTDESNEINDKQRNTPSKTFVISLCFACLAMVASPYFLSLYVDRNTKPVKGYEPMKDRQELSGTPVNSAPYTSGGPLTVDMVVDGKEVKAQSNVLNVPAIHVLIKSEINDGDNEPIELRGNYDNAVFVFDYVRANGLEVRLR